MLDVIRHEDMLCMCGHPRRVHRRGGCSAAKGKAQGADNELRVERCGCAKFQPAVTRTSSDWNRAGDASHQ